MTTTDLVGESTTSERKLPICSSEVLVAQVELFIKEELHRENVSWKKYFFKTAGNTKINVEVLMSDTAGLKAMDDFTNHVIQHIKQLKKEKGEKV